MNRHGLMQARIPAAGLLLVLLLPTVHAQPKEPDAKPPATVPYLDKSLGFELQLPAGWDYDRTGFFGPGGSLGLLRGAAPGGRATLQILVFRELESPSFPDWIDYFTRQLGSISGTKRVQVKGETGTQRPAAYVSVEAQLGIDQTQTLYYCVQFDQDTIWVFSQATAARKLVGETEDEADDSTGEVHIPAEFTRLTSTLRVFYDPATARLMAVALQRGKDYLVRYQLQDDIRKLRIDESLRYYEIRVADKPIGYLTRQFTRENEPLQRPGRLSNAKDGLRVRERSYRFADDGTLHFSKIDLFSSRDTETDLYELWQARIPPADDADPTVLITRDQCVREGDALFSTYTTSRDQAFPEPRRPLKLDATYLGLAWARLLPTLLGPQLQEMHAFTIYDSETRTLITHVIKHLGERPLPGSAATNARCFETRAGFVELPAVVYTDAYGNMLRYQAGELVLRLSSQVAIEQQFGQRRDAVNLRLEREQQRP
ncbi:MAG: hypothetical protein KKI02_07120 [Planctomycetes bacterium]|nr:hypothetical protein [Planctomycetota bacterium]